jgi:hypothetical protein
LDSVLSGVALLILACGGYGVLMLLGYPRRSFGGVQAASLAFLFGTGFVSILSFLFGLLLPAQLLRPLISAVCLLLGGVAFWRHAASATTSWNMRPTRLVDMLITLGNGVRQRPLVALLTCGLSVVIAMQVATVSQLSADRPLAWDGLLVWEFKAHVSCLNDGAIPLSYFTDPTRVWSHQDYPLLVPLTEAWLYSWLGRCDQEAVKLVFPGFYLAAIGLLFAAGEHLGGSRLRGLIAAALPFFVPSLIVGAGSVTSGYADFPLATFYLAAALLLLEYVGTRDRGLLGAVGVMSALLPWVKQEGLVLWACLLVVASVEAARSRDARLFVAVLAPGLLVIGGWRLFLSVSGANVGHDFASPSIAILMANYPRVREVSAATAVELMNMERWGLLWPCSLLGLLLLAWSARSKHRAVIRPHIVVMLTCLTLLPLALYQCIFIFSTWRPFTDHVDSSLPRLILQTALLPILVLGLLVPVPGTGRWLAAARRSEP